jgi:hypothetical protein
MHQQDEKSNPEFTLRTRRLERQRLWLAVAAAVRKLQLQTDARTDALALRYWAAQHAPGANAADLTLW